MYKLLGWLISPQLLQNFSGLQTPVYKKSLINANASLLHVQHDYCKCTSSSYCSTSTVHTSYFHYSISVQYCTSYFLKKNQIQKTKLIALIPNLLIPTALSSRYMFQTLHHLVLVRLFHNNSTAAFPNVEFNKVYIWAIPRQQGHKRKHEILQICTSEHCF